MDIVANSLSAGKLKTGDVTVGGKDIFEWFQSKLSVAVSFIGVFDDLSAAPMKNGAIAIVGSKDYIYSENAGKWQEFGDEGRIGTIQEAVEAISCDLSDYVLSDDLSGYYGKSETSSATQLKDEFDNYYVKNETSSSGEISAALCAIMSAKDFSTALSGKTYNYGDSITWMVSAIVDIVSAMGGTVIMQ